jgi:hypothetical protein
VVGVDTHLDTHTAAVCDARDQELARLQVSAVPEEYAAVLSWARETTRRLVGRTGDDGRVSFDLHAFPPTGPRTVSEVRQLMDAEEQRLITATHDALPPLGPEMVRFKDEIERRWRPLEVDPDGSPWSISPLWQSMTGGGTGFNIVWSRAPEMYTAILEIAARTNVIIYDPQVPEVILPPGLT